MTFPIPLPVDNAAPYTYTDAIRRGIAAANDHESRLDVLEAPGGGGGGTVYGPSGWFDVTKYGAGVGTGSTSVDNTAFQAAIDDALARQGSTLYIPPPPGGFAYQLNTKIRWYNPASTDNQIHLNVRADLSWHGIMWVGGSNSTVFESRGLKFATIDGLHVTIQANAQNVTVWDMDVGVFGATNYTSTGVVKFENCFFSTNAGGATITGWRLSHSSNTADISMVKWDTCYVQGDMGTSAGSRTSTGWVWEGSNNLNMIWVNSSASFVAKSWSTQPTAGSAGTHGGDCMYWFGCGASYADLIFDTKTTGTYLCSGGRFEESGQLIKVDQTNYQGHTSWTLIATKIESFIPPGGRLIDIGSACTLLWTGGAIRLLTSAADTDMIYASTSSGGYGYIELKGVGLPGDAPSGGSTTTGPTWVGGVTTGTGTWIVKFIGCPRTDASNNAVSMVNY